MVTSAKNNMTEPPTKIMIQLWFNISDKYKSIHHQLEFIDYKTQIFDNL